MKTAAWIALLTALLAAAPSAWAQPGDGRRGLGQGGGRFFAERQQLRQQRAEREALRDDGRDADASRQERCDGPCRMSPEERQQLRRDIHDAGRDFYRRGQRRGE